MKATLETMLAAEQRIIDRELKEITCDPPLVRAEIRAELLREILSKIDQQSTKEVNHATHQPA